MAMYTEQEWLDAYAELPLTSDPQAWKTNLGDYLEETTAGLSLANFIIADPPFTFNKDVFVSNLTDVNGVLGLSTAFSQAITSSTMVVSTGDSISNPAAPPSSILGATPPPTCTVVPASIQTGANVILTLASAPLTNDPNNSQFPIKLRQAFAGLLYSVVGVDSTPAPSGPLPINLPSVTVE